jgi:2-oxo-4-hydroxy-4-carboxy-5-ureidoimidazoline decarboxylase
MKVTPSHEELLNCLRIERWATDLSGHSYSTMLELERTAVAAATPLSTAEIDEALSAYPRVGEDPEGNAAYEQRFGRVFVIRAEGRSPEEIAQERDRRLENDDVAELAEIANQLRGLALVRLRSMYFQQLAETS